jgi:hypothetical protein
MREVGVKENLLVTLDTEYLLFILVFGLTLFLTLSAILLIYSQTLLL